MTGTEIKKRIDEEFKRLNSLFGILINNELLTTEDGKIIYCHYDSDAKEAVFGTHKRVNNKSKFVADAELADLVIAMLSDTEILGTDLGVQENMIALDFKFDNSLKMVNISSNIFNALFDSIYLEGKQSIRLINNDISAAQCDELFDKFDNHALYCYIKFLDKKVNKYIRGKAKYMIDLKIRFNFDCYRVLMYDSSLVKNPFLYCSKYRNSITSSKLFQSAEAMDINNMFIYLCSDRDICRYLNFRDFRKTNTKFLTNLIMGFYNDNFPNKIPIYLNTINKVTLTYEQYIELPVDQRQDYMEVNTLLLLCDNFTRTLGGGLYDCVEKASFVY